MPLLSPCERYHFSIGWPRGTYRGKWRAARAAAAADKDRNVTLRDGQAARVNFDKPAEMAAEDPKAGDERYSAA